MWERTPKQSNSKPELWGLQFTIGLPYKISEQIKWSCNILHDHKRATGLDIHVYFKIELSKLSWVCPVFKKVFLWTVRLTSDFLLSSEKYSATKKRWYITISFLAPNYYPSLSLCWKGFSKSWRNRWPCSLQCGTERLWWMGGQWGTGLTVAGPASRIQERPQRTGRVCKIISCSIPF